jgi:hypothetical protein
MNRLFNAIVRQNRSAKVPLKIKPTEGDLRGEESTLLTSSFEEQDHKAKIHSIVSNIIKPMNTGLPRITKVEADYNQRIYTEQQRANFENKSVQKQIERLRNLTTSNSANSPFNLKKILRLQGSVRHLMSFYVKNKFYLNETLILLFLRKLTETVLKEQKNWNELKKQASKDGKVLSSTQLSFHDKSFIDLTQYIDSNFSNFSPNSQISILVYLNKISSKTFKDVIKSKITYIGTEAHVKALNLRYKGLLFWLLASVEIKNASIIKIVNNSIADDIMNLHAQNIPVITILKLDNNKSSDEQSNSKEEDEVDVPDHEIDHPIDDTTPKSKEGDLKIFTSKDSIPLKEFCRLFWCLNVLNYHGKLSAILVNVFLNYNGHSYLSYTDIYHIAFGLSIIPSEFKTAIQKVLEDKIHSTSISVLAKENERTLVNIIVVFTQNRIADSSSNKLLKAILHSRRSFSPKTLSLAIWSISINKPELSKYEKLLIQDCIFKTLEGAKVKDIVQILFGLYKISLDNEYFAKEANFDINGLTNALLKRLDLSRKEVSKIELPFLIQMYNSKDSRYSFLKTFVKATSSFKSVNRE